MPPGEDSSEKTEEPTPFKLRKAQEQGQIPQSRELTAGLFLFTLSVFIYFYFPMFVKQSGELFSVFFQFPATQIEAQNVTQLLSVTLFMMGKILLPIFVILFAMAFLSNVLIVGFRISFKSLRLNFDKLNFFAQLPKFFDVKRKGMELVKALLKISLLTIVGVMIIRSRMEDLMRMGDAEWRDSSVFTAKLLHELLWKMSLAVMAIGFIDFVYQKWQTHQDLKMTKQEVKEDWKMAEGDPQVKQRIKQAQKDAAEKRVEQAKNADAVIRNPTHYAVAIKYDREKDSQTGPRVIAKGEGLLALRLIDIAQEAGVYIHTDKALAQTLFKAVDVGYSIPENLFNAVAIILGEAFRRREQRGK
ncbi:hypothetical protein RsTz2092_08020 [Deferribacterales bacterium RsTz2092]|nr:hypothetical protein AGMMS49941_08640 [Deferribacterales bacterium]